MRFGKDSVETSHLGNFKQCLRLPLSGGSRLDPWPGIQDLTRCVVQAKGKNRKDS